jgi:hypothetical protein
MSGPAGALFAPHNESVMTTSDHVMGGVSSAVFEPQVQHGQVQQHGPAPPIPDVVGM